MVNMGAKTTNLTAARPSRTTYEPAATATTTAVKKSVVEALRKSFLYPSPSQPAPPSTNTTNATSANQNSSAGGAAAGEKR